MWMWRLLPHTGPEAVRRAVEKVSANPYFTFQGYIAQPEIDRVLRTGKADVVVVFADDFDRITVTGTGGAAVQLVVDASNPNNATSATAYLQSVLLAGEAASAGVPETRLLYNPQMKSAYNFVPGIMGLIFILICTLMTSVSIVREKEMGTMEVLLVSPVRPVWIIFAKMIPYFMLSCLNLVSILLLARYLLDVPMSGSVTGLVGMSLLYIVLSLALGLLISTVSKKQVTAMIISGMLLIMPIIMLSGMVVSGGKYARCAARRFLYYPRPLVYFRCAEADDRGVAFPRCADGGFYFGRNDGVYRGSGIEKV